jgi:hypothetical protein
MTVHRGAYEALGSAHDAVLRWCADHDRAASRTRWEIYGHWHDDPTGVETEVYWLLTPPAA